MKIEGIVPAMVTPLDDSGINEKETRKLVDHLIRQGVHALFVLGTNGEFYSLTKEEKLTLVKIVVEEVAGRVPVFAGAGGISTNSVIDLATEFADLGVSAVSVITPYLMKITDQELLHHYQMIADNSPVPVILYNIPANTHLSISKAVFKDLNQHPNIVGIKDSSGDMAALQSYIDTNRRSDFSVLVGSDSKILTALQMGANGAVAATANVLTKTDLAIYHYFKEKQLEKAQAAQASIEEFRRILKLGTVPSVLKYCLQEIGYAVGNPKLPVLPVAAEHYAEIAAVLQTYQAVEGFWKEN